MVRTGIGVRRIAVTQNPDIIRRCDAECRRFWPGTMIRKQDCLRGCSLLITLEKARCTGGLACRSRLKRQARLAPGGRGMGDDKIIESVETGDPLHRRPAMKTRSLASMGIYVFDAEYLYQLSMAEDDRDEGSSHDSAVILSPELRRQVKALCARLVPAPPASRSDNTAEPYWRDVGIP